MRAQPTYASEDGGDTLRLGGMTANVSNTPERHFLQRLSGV